MAEGWIKLWRQSIDSRVFSDAELWKLWTWCLMRANHSDRFFEGELIARGSFVTGTRSAASDLGSSIATTHRRFKKLSDWKMIEIKAERDFTIITVLKYETYNGSGDDCETRPERERNADEMQMEPPRNTDETTVEPIKNYQELQELGEGKNNPPTPQRKTKVASEPEPQLPPSIRTPEMVAAVESWIAYKAERRESYKSQGLKALYARIANVAAVHGAQFVIDRMERAKASGWKGWDHEEKPPTGRGSPMFGDPDDPRGNMAAGHAFLRGST